MLQTIRRYVRTFFGCRACSEHFEAVAKESVGAVKTTDRAILWLWETHNLVNSRLAGEQKPPWGGQAGSRGGAAVGVRPCTQTPSERGCVDGWLPGGRPRTQLPQPPASPPFPALPPRGGCQALRTVGGRGSNRCPESRWRRGGPLSAKHTAKAALCKCGTCAASRLIQTVPPNHRQIEIRLKNNSADR